MLTLYIKVLFLFQLLGFNSILWKRKKMKKVFWDILCAVTKLFSSTVNSESSKGKFKRLPKDSIKNLAFSLCLRVVMTFARDGARKRLEDSKILELIENECSFIESTL